jgi:hypothetical protein
MKRKETSASETAAAGRVGAEPRFSDGTAHAIRMAVREDPRARGSALLHALTAACAEAHAEQLGPEHVLIAFRTIWSEAGPPEGVSGDEWKKRYTAALDACLAEYFSIERAIVTGPPREPRVADRD